MLAIIVLTLLPIAALVSIAVTIFIPASSLKAILLFIERHKLSKSSNFSKNAFGCASFSYLPLKLRV